MSKYVPGVCNIGKEEELLRKNIAVISFAVSLIYLILIISFNLIPIIKIFIFIPIFISIISFLQYKMHFCAEFGILGKYNSTNKIGETIGVEQSEYLRLDRIKALKILSYSLLISVAVTLVVLILL